MRSIVVVAILVAMVIAIAAAPAGAKPVVTEVEGVTVDWSRGLLIAKAAGPADRRAPSPAVARGGARKKAVAAARTKLLAAAKALPWAPGGTLGKAIKAADAETALTAALEQSIELKVDWLTDGSSRVEVGLPIEALRLAVLGPRPIDLSGSGSGSASAPPTTLIVDARKLTVPPSINLALTAAKKTASMPVVFVATPPADSAAALGPRVRKVKATSGPGKAGALAIDGDVDVVAAATAGTLVVVVVTQKP